jgi:hypothetical protein
MSYVSIEVIRNELMDREPSDNPRSGDLEFSDEDIKKAMELTIAASRMVRPLHIDVAPDSWSKIPLDGGWIYGVIWKLLSSHIHRLTRQDVDIQVSGGTGGGGINLVRRRIEHMSKARDEARDMFLAHIANVKTRANITSGYSILG